MFSQATIQAIWLSKFFDKIGLPFKESVVINADNNSAISNSLNNKNYLCTKHINIRYYFIKDCVAWGQVTFHYTLLSENIADILTKPLPRDTMQKFTLHLESGQSPVESAYLGEILQ